MYKEDKDWYLEVEARIAKQFNIKNVYNKGFRVGQIQVDKVVAEKHDSTEDATQGIDVKEVVNNI